MTTVLRLLVFLIVFACTALFNAGLIDVRFEEIRYLLGTIASTDDLSNTFGIVAKYELIKRRMLYGDENITNYEFEAKMQALLSETDKPGLDESNRGVHLQPVRFVLNGIRLLLGKPIINPKEEDKIFSVLEIGYFWERNRRYTEALKIYDEVLTTAHLNPEVRAALLVHKSFCHSMLSRYDQSKKIYEQVINMYPNTDAGILSWKLLDFITSMEKERESVKKMQLSAMDKGKQFYLLMDFRNAIKSYSTYLSGQQSGKNVVEARFYKGRSHEELGETEEALLEYRTVMKLDATHQWARQANRRMLMLGEFYDRQKGIAEEAKRQLDAYQDQVFIRNVEKYAAFAGKSTLKGELAREAEEHGKAPSTEDSIFQLINRIGSLDLTGNQAGKRREMEKIERDLLDKGTLSKAEIKELQRRQYLADNPYRRPSALKRYIDENSSELRYIYNKRLRTGVKLSGRMLVEMRIKADGMVTETKLIQSDMGDTQFEQRILEQIRTWRFKAVPDSLGSLTVNYPFEFMEED